MNETIRLKKPCHVKNFCLTNIVASKQIIKLSIRWFQGLFQVA